jgi:hypothetical protein
MLFGSVTDTWKALPSIFGCNTGRWAPVPDASVKLPVQVTGAPEMAM